MEHIAKVNVGSPYTATEAGRALLAAMNAEEPFTLLSTLPQRLEELCTIQGRQESAERQLVGDITLSQSQNFDSISSGLFQIKEWRDELRSSLGFHVQHLQRDVDEIQELLEGLHHGRQAGALPRRNRALEKSFSDLSDELSKLQDTNKQISTISRYVCNVAEGLASDGQSPDSIIHRTSHETSLIQDNRDAFLHSNHPFLSSAEFVDHGARGDAEGHLLSHDIETRCRELEAAILRNNATIGRQSQEIDRLFRVL